MMVETTERGGQISAGPTYEELLDNAVLRLEAAGVAEAELDAWYILSDTFHISRAEYLWRKKERPGQIPQLWQERVKERCRRVPLAYLLGETEFMGLSFRVRSGVLIPRQDTETLVEWILAEEKDRAAAASGGALLDLCCGTGCIGLSLACLGGWQPTLCDISETAVELACENAQQLGCKARILRGDLFGALPAGERFTVIASNPPYIATAVIDELMPEVKDYEPRLALDGEADGLAFYRRIAGEAGNYLARGGRLYLEIGYDQGESVPELLRAAGFAQVEVRKDLAGNDRVVRGVYLDV